ncbi:MAG: hypothetical protein ACREQR_13390 [Candidatus Binataceae bacterium]
MRKRITDVAPEYIKPPLPLAPEVRKSTAGECVIVVPVPKSSTPRAVEYGGRTEYWKRYGTDKRQMSHAEVEKAMGSTAQEQELETQRRLASDPTRLNEVTDVRVLWEALDKGFKETIGARRYLRLTVTPMELKPDRVDVADDQPRLFVWYPQVGQRENGWNVRTGGWGAQIALG